MKQIAANFKQVPRSAWLSFGKCCLLLVAQLSLVFVLVATVSGCSNVRIAKDGYQIGEIDLVKLYCSLSPEERRSVPIGKDSIPVCDR